VDVSLSPFRMRDRNVPPIGGILMYTDRWGFLTPHDETRMSRLSSLRIEVHIERYSSDKLRTVLARKDRG